MRKLKPWVPSRHWWALATLGILLTGGYGCAPAPRQAEQQPLPYQVDGTYQTFVSETIISAASAQAGVAVTDGGIANLSDSAIMKYGEARAGDDQRGESRPQHHDAPPGGAPSRGFGPPPGATSGSFAGGPGGMPPGNGKRPEKPGQEPPGQPSQTATAKIGQQTAAVFVGADSSANLTDVSILTSLNEGKGLCAIGDKAQIRAERTRIVTDGPSSHGVFAAEGGVASLQDLTILTSGEHSSAVATDRGGGVITVNGGSYVVTGKYSAAVYSTGDIRVKDATVSAAADNAVVIEGGSSATLGDCRVLSYQKGAVMIYQSFSGDASLGDSRFTMTGGAITAHKGPLFYLTNTNGKVLLNNVNLYGSDGILLKSLKGEWGVDLPDAKPTRGAHAQLIAEHQSLPGDIIVDKDSEVKIVLSRESTLTGAVNQDGQGQASVSLDKTSRWTLTADSYVTRISLPSDALSQLSKYLIGNGHDIYYDIGACSELNGKSYALENGGRLRPRL